MRGKNVVLAENAGEGEGAAMSWQGGKGCFTAEATWGGGSAKLQFKTLNGIWVDVDGLSLSANGHKTFELPIGEIRVVVETASAVYAYAHPM